MQLTFLLLNNNNLPIDSKIQNLIYKDIDKFVYLKKNIRDTFVFTKYKSKKY